MQVEPKKFSVEIKGQTLSYSYYLSHEGTTYKSGLINLFIQADEPGKKAVRAIRITVPDAFAKKPEQEIEDLARAEILAFYSK